MESILNSIKKLLGLSEGQTHFDPDIIMHVNSVFSSLTQMGVGPSDGFRIQDDLNSWEEFIQGSTKIDLVKSYMHLRVKLLFDPPLNSAVIAAMKEDIKEMEWRLNTIAESAV